jgi:hypothetical protein
MYITEIYEQVRHVHGKLSRNRFCVEYLGTDRNYMNVCVNRGSDVSEQALLRLYKELSERARSWEQIAKSAPQQRAIYTQRQQQYQQLSSSVLERLIG